MSIAIDEKLTDFQFKNQTSPIDRLRKRIQEKISSLNANPEITKAVALPEVSEKGMLRFSVLIEFKNVESLSKIVDELGEADTRQVTKPTSTLKIEKSASALIFERSIYPRKETQTPNDAGPVRNKLRAQIRKELQSRLAGRYYTIRVNLPPADISLPQGVRLQQDEKGDYLLWRYEMSRLMDLSEAKRMNFVLNYPASSNQTVKILIFLAVMVLGVALSFLLRKNGQTKQVTAKTNSVSQQTATKEGQASKEEAGRNEANGLSAAYNSPTQNPASQSGKDRPERSDWQDLEL